MIVKARFRCETCSVFFDVGGEIHNIGEFQQVLQDAGWKVVHDKLATRHYCSSCPVAEF